MNRKFAIYGGTFDPVHRAHLSLADAAVSECGIDRLIFMPDRISPFKQGSDVTSGKDRYAMLQSVMHYNPAFSLSGYELGREGPSYTIETLEHWSGILDGELSFILGMDSAAEVDTWHRGGDILRNFPLITAFRPGTDSDEALAKLDSLRSSYGADIKVLEMLPIDISSTDIREKVRLGESISALVMPETEEYIFEHNLYR